MAPVTQFILLHELDPLKVYMLLLFSIKLLCYVTFSIIEILCIAAVMFMKR